ncbi:hypothetical protein [Massilia sp. S19_KUP03_FR1]|uniref:hypothetical protein n=1 Tax=Massilia sp. S19_KUP03_FR1 TaxID=3025503 RepID=UPI002FCDDDC8
MATRILVGLGLAGMAGLSNSQVTDIPDISAEALSIIGRELECGRPAVPNAILGCEILAQFSAAGSPDQKNFKISTVAGRRRWIGVTVISDKSSQPREAFQTSSPFQVLVVLGERYSSNFHKKLYFENGFGYSYIWPQNGRQVAMIESAAQSLLRGEFDPNNAVMPFAKQVDLRIDPARPSTGKSLILGDPHLFLRQSGGNFYLIELGSSKEGDKYYLSRIRLDALIKQM